MADQTELRMNLVAIKRVDPYAKDIINSSAHVAFYVFNNEDSEWEKTDIEGALFIYSRYAEPFHSIFINNRLNTNSLVEPIRGQIELQSKPPFLLYRNERSRIRGFWFYNNTECDRIGEIIQRLVTDCAEAEKLNPVVVNGGGGAGGAGGGTIPPGMLPAGMNGNGPPESEASNVDIFSMLTKAQEDYQNNAATTTAGGGGAKPDPAVINHAGMTVLGGHNMPIVPVPAAQPPQQQQQQPISNQNAPRSVVNFFAAAKQPAASEVPLFKTHAPVHTLEQIEKLHRASTPQKDLTIAGGGVATTGKLTPDLSELKRMGAIPIMGSGNGPHTPSGGLSELGTSPLATFLSAANLSSAMRMTNNQAAVPKAKLIDISELESRQNHHSQQQQQQQTPLHELLKKSDSIAVTGTTPTTPSIVRPALMPPTMFKPTAAASVGVTGSPGTGTAGPQTALSDLFTQVTSRSAGGPVAVSGPKVVPSSATGKQAGSSGAKGGGGKSRDGTGNTPPKQTGGTPKSVADILSKATANNNKQNNNNVHSAVSTASGNANGSNNNNNNNSSTAGGTVEPLTQNQLIQAVSYLIKHDPDFVRKLHEAYVRSFAEMMISN